MLLHEYKAVLTDLCAQLEEEIDLKRVDEAVVLELSPEEAVVLMSLLEREEAAFENIECCCEDCCEDCDEDLDVPATDPATEPAQKG